MTENESAIETLEFYKEERTFNSEDEASLDYAIKAIKEIEQYRAIGTVEECREAREQQRGKKPSKKQVGRNILMSKIYYCPICNKKLYDCALKNGKLDYVSSGSRKSKFCENCGQKLDWKEVIYESFKN